MLCSRIGQGKHLVQHDSVFGVQVHNSAHYVTWLGKLILGSEPLLSVRSTQKGGQERERE